MRYIILNILRYSGFLSLWRFFHRNEIAIFMLHGVMDDKQSAEWVPLRPRQRPDRLEESLRALSKHYNFISLHDAVKMLEGQIPLQPYSLIFTFDDGYRNNLKHALPILKRYGVDATFFISTGYVDNRKPYWVDRLDYALQMIKNDTCGTIEIRMGHHKLKLDNSNRNSLRGSFKEFIRCLKDEYPNDFNMMKSVDRIAQRLEKDSERSILDIYENDDWSAILTWDEIKKAAQQGVSFGSHTVDHIRLIITDEELIMDQPKRSKKALESNTGRPCEFFAYPSGNFDQRTEKIVRACGYKAAVTTVEGTNKVGDDLMTLRRFSFPTNKRPTEVLYVASGISATVDRLKNNIFHFNKKKCTK